MTPELQRRVEAALRFALGEPAGVLSARDLGGGSITSTERLETNRGVFVLKTMSEAEPSIFVAEAAGLELLAGANSGLRIPRVIHLERSAPSFLLLEYLAPSRPRSNFDELLGRGLAALHRVRHERFGLEFDNFCGATPQPNAPSGEWCRFYAEHRLGFQIERAARAGLLGRRERSSLEALVRRLPELIQEPPEGPALIHGDLWSGNVVIDESGSPALIDPACYFAHREAELGMMTTFGGFSARVYDAYHEAFPLLSGWRERNRIYQLYHLLNHLNLFGSSYLSAVMSAARV